MARSGWPTGQAAMPMLPATSATRRSISACARCARSSVASATQSSSISALRAPIICYPSRAQTARILARRRYDADSIQWARARARNCPRAGSGGRRPPGALRLLKLRALRAGAPTGTRPAGDESNETEAPMSRDTRPPRSGFESELGKARGVTGSSATDDDTIRLGCPMLTRVRLQGRQRGAIAPMRCSLGFALHTRDDASRCLAVEGPNSCWKSAPSWRVAAPPEPEAVVVETFAVVEVTITEVVELEIVGETLAPNGAHGAIGAGEPDHDATTADDATVGRCNGVDR